MSKEIPLGRLTDQAEAKEGQFFWQTGRRLVQNALVYVASSLLRIDYETLFGKTTRNTPHVASVSGNYTPDLALSNVHELTLTGNTVLQNPSNMRPGSTLILRIRQDAIGGRTVLFGSQYDFLTGGTPAVFLSPNAITYLSCYIPANRPTFLECPSPIAPPIQGVSVIADTTVGNEELVFANSGTTLPLVITLPNPPPREWKQYSIRNLNSQGVVTVRQTNGMVENQSTVNINASGQLRVGWDGGTYRFIA